MVARLYQSGSQKQLARDGVLLMDLQVAACGSFYNDTMLELTPTSGNLRTGKCACPCEPLATSTRRRLLATLRASSAVEFPVPSAIQHVPRFDTRPALILQLSLEDGVEFERPLHVGTARLETLHTTTAHCSVVSMHAILHTTLFSHGGEISTARTTGGEWTPPEATRVR